MSDDRGWMSPDLFRIGPGGELPVVSVTRLPPELEKRAAARTPRKPVPVQAGEPGFAGDPPFALGAVSGYRWWAITAPDTTAVPDPDFSPGPLRGMHAAWTGDVNTATCATGGVVNGAQVHAPDARVPDEGCYCGFYAWWELPGRYAVPASMLPVCGVIQGYGKVLLGTKGFRCEQARVLAVHLPDAGLPQDWHDVVMAGLAAMYPRAFVHRHLPSLLAEYPSDPYPGSM